MWQKATCDIWSVVSAILTMLKKPTSLKHNSGIPDGAQSNVTLLSKLKGSHWKDSTFTWVFKLKWSQPVRSVVRSSSDWWCRHHWVLLVKLERSGPEEGLSHLQVCSKAGYAQLCSLMLLQAFHKPWSGRTPPVCYVVNQRSQHTQVIPLLVTIIHQPQWHDRGRKA